MKLITCYNFKGGSHKTTSNTELATILASLGYKIAILDLDPQANTSFTLGNELTDLDFRKYAEDTETELKDIRQEINKNLHLYPTNPTKKLDELSDSVFLKKLFFFERQVYRELQKENYDFVFIDMSPKLDRMNSTRSDYHCRS